jgi:flagellar motor protein MotB
MVEPRSKTDAGSEGAQSAQAALALWQGRVRLARAMAQARSGDLATAEGTLHSGGDLAVSPLSLDLLARIRAQQGRLAEAQSLWMAASELDPDSAVYRTAARRAKAWQRFRVRPDLLRLLACAVTAALLAFVVWGVEHQRGAAVSVSRANLSTDQPGSPGAAKPLRPPVPSLASAPVTPPRASVARSPRTSISVAGAVSRDDGDATVLSFEEGLFGVGSVLTSAAGRILDDLAARLRKDSDDVVVTVTGHTDDLPVPAGGQFADNVSLGLARATAVAERLRRTADLKAGALVLRSLGSNEPPFPNDSREGRLRNRTVVIRISPRSDPEAR